METYYVLEARIASAQNWHEHSRDKSLSGAVKSKAHYKKKYKGETRIIKVTREVIEDKQKVYY